MAILDFLKNNSQSESIFGLLLKEQQGLVLLIKKTGSVTRLVDFDKFAYSDGWEHLLEDVDQALYKLETKHRVQLEQTIFFVFSHLIDESTNQIKKSYQQVIKNIVKNLELKALGFIDCREAVVKSVELNEDIPLTAILIELDKNNLNVFIYKGGQSVFNQLIARTDNLIDDLSVVFEGLKGKHLLPSRMILYNSKELDSEVTKIVSHRWSTDLFVQLPKVEIVNESEIVKGLVSVFNSQLVATEPKVKTHQSSTLTQTGFVIGEDIQDAEKKADRVQATKPPVSNQKFQFPKPNWIRIKSLANPSDWQKKILILVGLVIIIVSIFLNEYFLHRVELKVFVPSSELKKNLNIVVDTKGKEELTIKPITKIFELSTTQSTSGKRDIGESARGEVTVYNFDKERTLTKGTKIETKGISFSFDDEIKVASASLTSDGSAKLPGKAKVKVTAVQIGSESNLTKGQTFKIENLDQDQFFAKNEADLTGGSKKQITTVSKTDYSKLDTELLNKAKNHKPTDLEFEDDERMINLLSETKLTNTEYSKEIGEEADQITLKADVETTLYIYSKSKLMKILTNQLSDEIKSGYRLDTDKLQYEFESADQGEQSTDLKIRVIGKAIKEIDQERLISLLRGKKESQIDQILKTNFSSTGYNLQQKQSFSFLFFAKRLPLFSNNFKIKIDSL